MPPPCIYVYRHNSYCLMCKYQMDIGSFLGTNSPWSGGDHPPPSSTEFRAQYDYNFTPPQCRMAWHREKFTAFLVCRCQQFCEHIKGTFSRKCQKQPFLKYCISTVTDIIVLPYLRIRLSGGKMRTMQTTEMRFLSAGRAYKMTKRNSHKDIKE